MCRHLRRQRPSWAATQRLLHGLERLALHTHAALVLRRLLAQLLWCSLQHLDRHSVWAPHVCHALHTGLLPLLLLLLPLQWLGLLELGLWRRSRC
jgi:hypothetical protein